MTLQIINNDVQNFQSDYIKVENPICVINIPEQLRDEKPPEYDSCVVAPPCYDDAVQQSPPLLLHI